MDSQHIRVAIADDHPVIRVGIEAELDRFDLSRQLSSNRTQGIPNMIALIRESAGRLAT